MNIIVRNKQIKTTDIIKALRYTAKTGKMAGIYFNGFDHINIYEVEKIKSGKKWYFSFKYHIKTEKDGLIYRMTDFSDVKHAISNLMFIGVIRKNKKYNFENL